MKKTVLFLGAILCGVSFSKAQDCQDVFISEYVEGWSTNKAIEIYNPTANSVDLSNYIIARASNGTAISAIQENYAVQLSGTIAPFDVYVGVVNLVDPSGSGQTAPVWDSLQARADGFYSPDYNTNSTFYWNGDDAILLLKGTLTGTATTTLVSITPALSIVDIFGKIGEDPGTGWTSVAPYVGTGDMVTADHSLIRKSTVLKGVTNDAIAYFNPLGEYDSIPPVTYLLDNNGDTILNNDLTPKLFGNWFSLGSHTCDCSSAGVKKIMNDDIISIFPNPSNGTFTLKGIALVDKIEVINTLGQVIEKIENNSKSIMSVDIDNKGVYLVRFTSTTGEYFTKKVIVK